jgi:hypothetical protein
MSQNLFGVVAAMSCLVVSACATTQSQYSIAQPLAAPMPAQSADFDIDREMILAMVGEFEVTFDFTEYLPIAEGYQLKDPKVTPAREIVYVAEDTGEYIALQHLLLVGDAENPFVVKHWRQDWQYQPERLMSYRGFGTWDMVEVSDADASGAWSQTVYQVDDSPRYAGLAAWSHDANASTWEPGDSWRPLPRRDATTRDDYDVIEAMNRHTVTLWGWTHEQDNSKLALRDGVERELVREHGINTYRRADLDSTATDNYWAATSDFWKDIRDAWTGIIANSETFIAEDDADGTLLYGPVLGEGQAVFFGAKSEEQALDAAFDVIELRVMADGEAVELR